MLRIQGLDELRALTGRELGVSDWREVDQATIDVFADATGDHYWIHVDPERAKDGPHGSTIAHGLYTLSLGPTFLDSIVDLDFRVRLNYGYQRVRFPAPLPVGSRVRMRSEVLEVADREPGAQVTVLQTFERDGGEKPVCVAQQVVYVSP